MAVHLRKDGRNIGSDLCQTFARPAALDDAALPTAGMEHGQRQFDTGGTRHEKTDRDFILRVQHRARPAKTVNMRIMLHHVVQLVLTLGVHSLSGVDFGRQMFQRIGIEDLAFTAFTDLGQ